MKVHRNCCGLDVHKQTIAACLIYEDGIGNSCKEKRDVALHVTAIAE